MTHIITDSAISMVIDGESFVVSTSNAQAPGILRAIDNEAPEEEIKELFNLAKSMENYVESRIRVENEEVIFDGAPLRGIVADRILEFMRLGKPARPLIKFLDKLMSNPSKKSIESLYPFLESCGLVITEDGDFLGYKGIQDDYWSVSGGDNSQVLIGQTNEQGQIYNGIGERIKLKRGYVCDDTSQGCSSGLHVGTLDYASGWGSRVVLVQVNPKDVVSVPNEHGFQKLRVCDYYIRQDCTGKVTQEMEVPSMKYGQVPKVNTFSRTTDDNSPFTVLVTQASGIVIESFMVEVIATTGDPDWDQEVQNTHDRIDGILKNGNLVKITDQYDIDITDEVLSKIKGN